MTDEPTVWCPSCGSEYRVGSQQCADCRVALVNERPPFVDIGDDDDDRVDDAGGLVELGEWPRLQAQVLRRRLESAGIAVMVEWSGPTGDAHGILLVGEEQSEFASAVINEIEVDDEVSDDSPHAYVARIEELLAAAGGLLDELRTRLDRLESEGRL